MDTVKIDKKSSKMISHAGLAGLEAINSIAGYVAAGNRSYYGIETDIRRTLDGRFVAFHDKTLEARAGIEATVESSTFEALSSLILSDKNGTRSRRDTVIPTLEDYINICKYYEKHAVLELSGPYEREWIKEIIAAIEELGYIESTTFISFYYDNLLFVRKILPEQSVQFIFSDTSDRNIDRLINDGIDADIRYSCVSREVIEKLHSAGRRVNCYTVDSVDAAEELVSLGVDYITTNILE